MTFQWIAELPPAIITASAAFVGGILGTLLTIFATPRMQHRIWKRQRLIDVRFTIVNEVKRLVAEFKASYLFKDMVDNTSERAFTLGESWIAVSHDVKDFFSDSTFRAFERMYTHVITTPLFSTQEITDRTPRLAQFDQVREIAMRALYKEVGIL